MTTADRKISHRFLKALSGLEPNEVKATLVSALFVAILMGSYFPLRAARDAMASDWTDSEVSFLWNINFVISAAIVSLYGLAVSRLKLRTVVPIMYGFFAISFIIFYLVSTNSEHPVLIDKAYYLWVSVFALFNVSVFWTFMSDTFNPEQATRCFGIIMAGSSTGALIGPAIPAIFAESIGIDALILVASVGLLLVIPLIFYVYHLKGTELGNADLQADTSNAVLGGRWWEGFKSFATNRYLLLIGVFILLYVFINTFFYFEQKNLLEDYTRAERARILGSIDWLVNLLTFGMAALLTGRIVKKMGMPFSLAIMPILMAIGFLILAFAPILTVLLAMQVFRRGGNYGLTRPAREMLFTRCTQEERFKAKPVVDVVVYRGGDAVSGTLFAFLTDGIGLGLAAVAVVGSGIAAVWGGIGIWLGKAFGRQSKGEAQE